MDHIIEKSFFVGVLIYLYDDIIFKVPGLKTSVKMTFFGLKYGQDLENWAAHPHQEFPGVTPGIIVKIGLCFSLATKLSMDLKFTILAMKQEQRMKK